MSYFILSLRFCQVLAANKDKNSPLVVMKDIKMQRGLWVLWACLFPFAAFAAEYWPQCNRTSGRKRRTEQTWVTNDRSVLPFEEEGKTPSCFAIKLSFIPLPLPWEIAVWIFAFLWGNEVVLASWGMFSFKGKLVFSIVLMRCEGDGGAIDLLHLQLSASHLCCAWGTVLLPDTNKTHVVPDVIEF